MDGKITLNRQQLKNLRRKLGISQEQLALQCAERGLCVSVASIKRAETAKNILYRTARDIARFYQIGIEELIVDSGVEKNAGLDQHFETNRQLVLLRCCWQEGEVGEGDTASISDVMHDFSEQFRGRLFRTTDVELLYIFGADGTRATEALQAGFFALKLEQYTERRKLPSPLCLLIGAELASNQELSELVHLSKSLFDATQDALFARLKAGWIIAEERLQPQLQNRFTCQPLAIRQFPAVWRIELCANRQQPTLALAGRRVELMQFRAILDSTTGFGNAHAVSVSGVAGIGKTHLQSEFRALAETEGMHSCYISLLDFGSRRSYQLLSQLTRQLLAIPADVEQAGDCSVNLAEQLGSAEASQIAMTMLGWTLDEEQSRWLSVTPPRVLVERQVQLAARLLLHEAKCQPQLVVIEDMHWADEKSRQFLLDLLPLIEELPIIFLLTGRPEVEFENVVQDISKFIPLTHITLAPLGAENAVEMAGQFPQLSEGHRRTCIEKSQGNPLFLEYLLRETGKDSGTNLPFTLQALILSLLDQLDEQDRHAAIAAAVIGQHFSLEMLRSVLNLEHYDPQPLIDQSIIHRRGNECHFHHALIRDGVYQSIVDSGRRQLHQRCAEMYLRIDSAQAIKHYHRARSADISLHLLPAISQLVDNFQYDVALELIELGREVDYAAIGCYSLYLWHAEILYKLGEIGQSISVAGEAAAASASSEEKIITLLLQAKGHNTLDDFPHALRCIETAEDIAIKNRLLAQLAKIYGLKGDFYFPRGDVEKCFSYQQKSLSYANKIDDHRLRASALGGLGDAAYAQGKMHSAYDFFRQCLALCYEHDLLGIEAPNLFMLGTLRIYQNQYVQALQDTLRGIELVHRVGNKRAEIVSHLTAGWVYLDNLQLVEAEGHIAAGLALAEQIGARRFVPFLEESQARLFFGQGDERRAQATIATALERVEQLNAHNFIGPWLLGTQALLSDNPGNASDSLAKGEAILARGCIGHNYFRFYVAAMEYGLLNHKPDIVTRSARALRSFTADEPTAWSSFYLDRADFLLRTQSGELPVDHLHQSLLQRGVDAGLKVALPLLKESMRDGAIA